jgi:hypothetical protein
VSAFDKIKFKPFEMKKILYREKNKTSLCTYGAMQFSKMYHTLAK